MLYIIFSFQFLFRTIYARLLATATRISTFRLNFGNKVCNNSLTLSLSAAWAGWPPRLIKWKVDETPLCKTTCNCTFAFPSGEIFWAVKKQCYSITLNLLSYIENIQAVWTTNSNKKHLHHQWIRNYLNKDMYENNE